jgi:hypothetical protein
MGALEHYCTPVYNARRFFKLHPPGVIALQLHAGQPMTVEFKNLRIKQ